MTSFSRAALIALGVALAVAHAPTPARAQQPLAGTIVASDKEMAEVVKGLSVKEQVLGKPVLSNNGATIGQVSDVILGKGGTAAYGIVEISAGLLGLGTKLVAVPADQFRYEAGAFILPDTTEEMLKAAPTFKYAR